MDWDNLRFFLAVARKNSVRGASAILDVNASTVSRRIDAFEKQIGVRLFERLPSGYLLTSAGEEMVGAAERIENEVAALDRSVIGRDSELSGTLRITMPVALASQVLMPDFAAFSAKYPSIKLELALSSEEFNLSKREADVAIRITNSPPEYLVGRCATQLSKAIYASNEYIKRHKPLDHPELARWVGMENHKPDDQWIKETGFADTIYHHQSNDLLVQFEACKAGMGLVVLPCFMADPSPELQRVSPLTSIVCGDLWILTHKDLRSTVRVKIFMDYMFNVFQKHRDLFEGNMSSKTEAQQELTINNPPNNNPITPENFQSA